MIGKWKNLKPKELNATTENTKVILCCNIIFRGHCDYESRCNYAHSLDEQMIDPIRKQAYDILKSTEPLHNIVLKDDLYNTMKELTQICPKCANNKCLGGYNCKMGAINEKYCVCSMDLNLGNCLDKNCKKIHLTQRGFLPVLKTKTLSDDDISDISDTEITYVHKKEEKTEKEKCLKALCDKSIFE